MLSCMFVVIKNVTFDVLCGIVIKTCYFFCLMWLKVYDV